MLNEKINIREITENFTVKIPLCQQVSPADKEFYVREEFVAVECQSAINPIVDNDKFRYTPTVPRLRYTYKKDPVTRFTYQDLGFTDDDVTFRRNSFVNSFLRLQFFDTNLVSNRRLIFEIVLFTQLGPDQLDTELSPLPVAQMPVTFSSYDPVTFPSILYNSEGYFQHVRSSTSELYMYAFYSNAKDGSITPVISKGESILFNTLNDFNWIKYSYNSATYEPDGTDRVISTSTSLIDLCLFNITFV